MLQIRWIHFGWLYVTIENNVSTGKALPFLFAFRLQIGANGGTVPETLQPNL